MKKLNKKAAAGIGLGALALVGGTFAYYSQTASLDNPLSTGKYTTQLVEDYTPPTEDLKPGAKWDKNVGAENTGDYPVLVRVSMKENWSYKGAMDPYKTILSNSELFDNGTYAGGIFDAAQINDTDGLTPAEDGTVVHKNILTDAGWIDGGDGYWYWNGVLEKKGSDKSSTTHLLEGLTMATDIDLGHYETKEYYAIAETQPDLDNTNAWTLIDWTQVDDENNDGLKDIRDLAAVTAIPEGESLFRKSESNLDSDKKGYGDSNYTLTVTSEFVQATKDAVTDSWAGFNLNQLTNVQVNAEDGVNLENKTVTP
ncbi:MAG: hypothetical protein ENTB_02253 [Enterocloster aldenensis]